MFQFTITMKFEILILTCLFGLILASKNMTSSSSSESEESSEHSLERKEYSKSIWAQLDQKQKDCIKEKYAKDSKGIKTEMKKCFDKKGGLPCVKAIAQLQPCFA